MAKGQKKNKKYRKKRRLRVLYQLLSVVLVLAAIVAGCVIFFKVEEVEVIGSTRYSEEYILGVAAVDENANLLLLPSSAIRERLIEACPYVDQVSMKRAFPTTLQIVIEECVPVAAIQTNGAWFVLDSNGKILERVEESIANMYIRVDGLSLLEEQEREADQEDGEEEDPEPILVEIIQEVGKPLRVSEEDVIKLKGLCALLNAIKVKALAEEIGWIDVSSGTEIEMAYDGRFLVRLPITPSGEDTINAFFLRKVEAMIAMKEEKTAPGEQGIIDLRDEVKGYFRPRDEFSV